MVLILGYPHIPTSSGLWLSMWKSAYLQNQHSRSLGNAPRLGENAGHCCFGYTLQFVGGSDNRFATFFLVTTIATSVHFQGKSTRPRLCVEYSTFFHIMRICTDFYSFCTFFALKLVEKRIFLCYNIFVEIYVLQN